ncbi:IF44L-like protein [Mya arenaria]|uniref:IF44L-like protein n=1 Tax=Mya arenaria TaxID=6604 RepID=A0ABY7GBA2_MYAAR|nr:interferon-induced protein 44-like [Mya arenaria]WAR31670.1 IF44L-like protein [Mya arenaria]
MDGKLSQSNKEQLEYFVGLGPRRFTLLYSITRDGCSSDTFHQRCDYQGPTVTVLYNQQGSVYGGYTSASWSSNGTNTRDEKAFLFQLQYSGSNRPKKFPITNTAYSIYCEPSYGPMFGGYTAYDMNSFSGTINKSGTYYQLNGSCTYGANYAMSGVSSWNEIHNGNLQVTELEVYSVCVQPSTRSASTGTDDKEFVAWGKHPEFGDELRQELLQEIASMQPYSELKLQEYRVLLIGPVGAGKSSFVNTVCSAFKGRIVQRASCGEEQHSFTKSYQAYNVKTKKNASLHFRLCDTRGLEPDLGINIKEFDYLVNGHVPEKYEFNAEASISLEDKMFVVKPSLAEKVHCVVFVIDASTLNKLDPDVMKKMKEFVKITARGNTKQALLLTKIDIADSCVKESPKHAFKSRRIQDVVVTASKMFGFPRYSILPVKNYEEEAEMREVVDILALLALRKILHFAEDYMDGILNDRGIGAESLLYSESDDLALESEAASESA